MTAIRSRRTRSSPTSQKTSSSRHRDHDPSRRQLVLRHVVDPGRLRAGAGRSFRSSLLRWRSPCASAVRSRILFSGAEPRYRSPVACPSRLVRSSPSATPSANHDEAVFACPYDYKLDRGDTARKHLGFGWGIHLCVGAPLARLEMALGPGRGHRAASRPLDLAPGFDYDRVRFFMIARADPCRRRL